MWNNLRITQRFTVVLCMFWLLGASVIGMGLWGLSSARDNLKTLHDEAMRRALPADQVADLAVQSRMQVLLAFQHAPGSELASIHDHPVTFHLDAVSANMAKVDALQKDMGGAMEPRERALFEAAQAARAA